MNLYLYLTHAEWADSWINGGEVPFYVASRYRREERSGIFTPDENLIDSSTFDVKRISPYIKFGEDVRGLVLIGNKFDGEVIDGTVTRYHEDGLVICLCGKRSKFIARKLGKKACVKINDVVSLKKLIDDFTGIKGKEGRCSYTASHIRNHFLKSTYDEWQQEYRLFWHDVQDLKIQLPPNTAKLEFILP